MDTTSDRTPALEAQATPQTATDSSDCILRTPAEIQADAESHTRTRDLFRSAPWWLTREPTRWDQARMHCTCAALHARELARELWRALYAGACADRWLSRNGVAIAMLAAGLAMLILASGCKDKLPSGPATATGPDTHAATLGTATQAASEARDASAGAARVRDSRLAADMQAAGNALDAVPPRVPDARAAVAVAAGHLSGVAPDAAEAQSLASAERIRASGDASGADAAILALAAQARTDAADLATLRQRAAQAEADRDAAQAALIRAGEQGAQRLADALDKERRGVLRGQVAKLSWIGIGCCAGAALAIGAGIAIGGVAALRRVGPAAIALGVVGLGCLGAAQIIGARWFLPVVGACGGGAVLWFAVWAYRHQKRGDLAQELAVRSGKVAAVAKTAVPVLDAAYDEADAGVKAWLDEHVFARLSGVMDKQDKATVHAIRAEAQVASGVTG